MHTIRVALVAGFAPAILAGCQERAEAPPPPPAPTALVDAARVAGADAREWLTYGRTYDEQRFSPLDRIDAGNVGQLGLAWAFDLDTPHRAQESTPLVIDDVMYVTSAWSKLFALDAKTGRQRWMFDPQVPGEAGVNACCDVVNRGVGAWNGKLFLGTLDGRLIAVDAATGTPVWTVATTPPGSRYTITGAPRVFGGKVLIGNGGAEIGVRGYVTAYDAETGHQLWRFYTVPGDPARPFEHTDLEKAAKTWTGEWWKLGGGGTVWDSIVYDPKLDYIYIGVGNGSPWNQKLRSPKGGDNLYLSSIVALKAATGEYVWHFQTTPAETWDYTATQPMMLADLEIGGQPRQVLMQAPKNGYFYVLDRVTGEFISGAPFAHMNWSTGLDAKGRPRQAKEARYDQSGKPALVIPGPGGAHSWQPMSFSPVTGYVYFPVMESAFPFIPAAKAEASPRAWATGVDFNAGSMPANPVARAGAKAGLKGHLVAWDPVNQKEVWRAQFDQPWNGGTLATAGNLVFQGNSMGELVAYRATNGQKLWSAPTQAGVLAAPVTYEIDGEQYVAIEVGWGGAFGLAAGELARDSHIPSNLPRVLAFKLGGTAKLPPLAEVLAAPLDPPPEIGDAATWDAGKLAYHTYCTVCHGDAAVSGGVLPDLRLSAVNRDADAWQKIVRGGERQARGMVSFAQVLSARDGENIRAYVIHRAHEDQALEQAAARKAAAPASPPQP
jgi:alcohol dehydrogenase (cytochrome c)/quinohemoprotein ethanol dehydrogenase